jgi:hypothetical protein
VFSDDHYRKGEQGEFMMSQRQQAGHDSSGRLHLAVDGVPVCGTHDEVLNGHGLSGGYLFNISNKLSINKYKPFPG